MTEPSDSGSKHAIGRLIAGLSSTVAVTHLIGGTIAAFTADRAGTSLAVGLSFWMGNMEPNLPNLPFPWLLWLVLGPSVWSIGFALMRAGHRVPGFILEHLGAVGAVGVPIWHIARLVQLA